MEGTVETVSEVDLPTRLQMHASRWRSAGEVQLADTLDEAREALLEGRVVVEKRTAVGEGFTAQALSLWTLKWLTEAEAELRREGRVIYADVIAAVLPQK